MLQYTLFIILCLSFSAPFIHAGNRLKPDEDESVKKGVKRSDFETYYVQVKSGKCDELTKRKCYLAFEKFLWTGVGLNAPIPFERDRLESVPREIRKAPQVAVGPDKPFNIFDDPLETLRLMYDCYAAASVPVDKVQKHPSADYYPGKIAKSARSRKETLKIDVGGYQDIISTGLFAPAGEPVVITVPRGELTEKGCEIQIGALKQLTSVYKFTELHRAPYITRRYAIDRTRMEIVSAFGGLIYIRPKLPEHINVKQNEFMNEDGTFWTDKPIPVKNKIVQVTVEGAVRAPFYRYGIDSKAIWKSRISKYPAPIGEFGSDRFIYTMPAKKIMEIKDLDRTIECCNDMYDFMGDLTGRPNPPPHTFRAIVELDLNGGALYAGQPVTMSMRWVENLKTDIIEWGLAHETGHMHQKKAWTYQKGGEITVNIMAYYAIEKLVEKWGNFIPKDRRMNDDWLNESTRKWMSRPPDQRSWFSAGDRQRELLAFYIHLWEEFGWEPFKNVFREYREIPVAEWPGQDKRAQKNKEGMEIERKRAGLFCELLSKEVGKDLSPYFDAWGQEIDNASQARIEGMGLPKWLPKHAR